MTLETALNGHYAPSTPPVDPARRRLESRAHGFVPDPGMEEAIARRAAIGAEAYDREVTRVGASDGLQRALYEDQRTAAIAVGAWTPPTPEGASK